MALPRSARDPRSEEHTSELQSRETLVCRLLLEKKKIVTTDFGGAKKDRETTRKDLEAKKGNLDRVTGDMGMMSGLIARNHDDLEDFFLLMIRNQQKSTLFPYTTLFR